MVNNLYTNTLLKAYTILDCFENDNQELSIKELGARLNMPQSSVYRILQSLEFVGMIFQNKETKKYRMGTKVLSLADKSGEWNGFVERVYKHMQRLAEETGETVNLGAASCDCVSCIRKVESRHVLRPNFKINTLYPMYNTSIGRIFLAEMSPATLEWVYENNIDDIAMTYQEFLDMVKEVKDNGYAWDDEAFNQGLRCVAAPVYGLGGKVVFSISVSSPSIRMNDETYQKTRDLVVACCKVASEEV